MEEKTLFELIGGRPTLERAHKLFYDKVYDHPWLKGFFSGVDQKTIENQQTDFMTSNMGGGKIYSGALPENAHRHLFIDNELFNLRHSLLRESIRECGVPDNLAERWLRIDEAFRKSLVKKDPAQCEKRFFTDEIIIVPKPRVS
ncbi:MAG: group 1 truncated hemoglobin [Nitrospinaceae bacterium]